MSLRDLLALLRARWITIAVSTAIAVLGAIMLTLLTTPTYVAYSRLFVATPRSGSLSDLYEGDLYTKERVLSYAELLKGQTIAQRTLDKLHLDMSAAQLRNEVTPIVARDTVIIYLYISDQSPVRARDIANTMSDELVALINELENPPNSQSLGLPNRIVIEQRASLPQKPNKPDERRNIIAGLTIGLLAGLGLAVLRESLDDALKTEAKLEEITSSGVVGVIPQEKLARGAGSRFLAERSPATAEAFRVVRTNLKFLAVDHPPRFILIASPKRGDGKSTVAINTALALAEAEENVLIVDADLRRPDLSNTLGLSNEVGLSTVISGDASLDEALQQTSYPRLIALTAGQVPPNPSELLGSARSRHLFRELRSQFDYVIVDSSPLKSAADSAVLSVASDGVLLVARYDKTKIDDLLSAVSVLRKVGASLLGTVLNDVPKGKSKGSHYGDD